jgi:YD repeat-containing protein
MKTLFVASLTLGLAILLPLRLRADAPPTAVRIVNSGVDTEGLPTFRLEWNAISNATYLVQSRTNLGTGDFWSTVDAITPSSALGVYQLKGQSIPTISVKFFQLVLPQPEIFSVEPSVLTPGVAADLYIIGQCFSSNDVLRINGVAQNNTILLSSTLRSRPAFTPDVAGDYLFELVVAGQVRSSFHITCADAFSNPQAVLQGPPAEPLASPQAGWLSKKGYDYYKAQSDMASAGMNQNPYFTENGNQGEMPTSRPSAYLSKKGYDYYQSRSASGFDVPEGKKGLNAVNVKLASRVDPDGGGGGDSTELIGFNLQGRDNDQFVMPFSGEVQYQAVDLAVAGRGLDFVWGRTYRSRTGDRFNSGDRTSFSYDVGCVQSSGGMDVYDGAGRKDSYKLQTNGVYTCPEFFNEGTLSNNIFRLTFADTGYWEFNPLDGSATAGTLARVVDRLGNIISLRYAGGLLTQIVDDLGRTNTIVHNSDGRVSSVTDFSGRTVTYAYYVLGEAGGSPGDLKSVTSPPITGTPNGNDFPFGKTNTYTYSTGYANDAENHLLLSVIDASGLTTHQHVYQHNQSDLEFLRCTSIQCWTNAPATISYLPQTPTPTNQFSTLRCIINDPVGDVTECFFDARNRCVKIQDFTGRSTPGTRVSATVNRPTGKLRSGDPDIYECRAEWNNDSLCRTLYLFGGQQLQCLYESDFDKSAHPRKRADCRVVRELACCIGADTDGDGSFDLTEREWHFEYDSRFGSGRLRSGVIAEVGAGRPATVGRGSKGWDGTIKGLVDPSGNGMAIKQKGTGADNNRSLKPKGWDGTIKGLIVPSGNGMAIKQKGTGADNNRSLNPKGWDPKIKGLVVPSGSGMAINRKGTGAEANRAIKPRGWDGTIKGFQFVTSATDPRGNLSTANYETNGNVLHSAQYTRKGGAIIACDYNYKEYSRLAAITNAPDANGYRRVDRFNYYTNGPQAGYLSSIAIDESGVHLTASFEYDARGNLVRYVDPRTNDWLCAWNALDQCVRVQTPTNINSRCASDFFYDANDNLVQCSTEVRDDTDVKLGDRIATCGFDRLHRLTRAVCPVDASHSLTNDFVYDGDDQCVLALGGDAVAGIDPHQAVSFAYDERGMVFRATSAPGGADQSTTQYDYDSNGNLAGVSEGLEATPSLTTMEYDGFGGFGADITPMATGTRLRAQGSTPLAGAARWMEAAESPVGNARISKITDPMGNQVTFNYDACDNLKVVRRFGQTNDVPGTNGNLRLAESRYVYDELDRCVTSHDLFFDPATQAPIGDGACTTTFAYAPNDACASITDDLGRVTTYTYDTAGRLSSVSSPGNRTVFVCIRDAAGNMIQKSQTDTPDLGGAPQVFAWTNVYDSLNRCVRSIDNVGNTNRFAYDSLSRITVMFNPKEYSVSRTYDLLGRCTLAVADLNGDGLFDLSQDIYSVYVWSGSSDRLLASADSHGNTNRYGFDSLNRCTSITNADATRLSLVWSPRSNLIQETDANGTVIVHTYDLNDRCVGNTITPGAGVASSTTFESFAYDGCSRLVAATNDASHSEFTYDSHGNCTRGTSGGLGALTTFDSLGNRLTLTCPGGKSFAYSYDVLDQSTNILDAGSSLASFSYAGPERLARVNYGNGARAQITYDGFVGVQNAPADFGQGQVSNITHAVLLQGRLQKMASVDLQWDRNGNKSLRTDTIYAPSVPRTNNLSLTYDPADRLTRATVLSGTTLLRDTVYGLDQTGNRTNVTGAACSGAYTMSSATPPADYQMNQYTTTPCDSRSYDNNGNLINRTTATAGPVTCQYDFADRLIQVQALDFNTGTLAPVASYAYDALGRRISKTVYSSGLPPVITQFVFDGDDVIEERSNGALTHTFCYARLHQAENLRGQAFEDRFAAASHTQCACTHLRTGTPIATFSGTGTLQYYFHPDDQGNVLALTDQSGKLLERYDYDDYGAITFLTSEGVPSGANSSTVGNVYCWGGLRLDSETGLQNDDGGGYLEPQTGRAVRGKVKTIKDMGGSGRTVQNNNPWSAGSPPAMKKGTVKFFNDAKGFGRVVGRAALGHCYAMYGIMK